MSSGSVRRVSALALRIFRQFTRDRRTAMLIFVLPVVVMTLVSYLLEGPPSKIPFALIKESSGTSVIYEIIKDMLEEEDRVRLVSVDKNDVERSLREGRIRGALIIRGGGLDDMTEGRAAGMEVFFEGSDALATGELAAILARISRGLMPAVRDVVDVVGDETARALAGMEIKERYLYGGPTFTPTDYLAPVILGAFPFVLTFILTSISFLRERTSGTMERLLASPIGRVEVIVGYLAGFLIFTMIQACIILGFVLWVMEVHMVGAIGIVFFLVMIITMVGAGLGMFLSSFARTELQVAQFMPLVILPLLLVSGVFWPVETMPKWLWPLGYGSPLTWANIALRDVMVKGFGLVEIVNSFGILCFFAVVFVLLAAATLRRQLD